MAEVTGLSCILCRDSIGSIFDGVFCLECGGPYHHSCLGKPPVQPAARPCHYCKGDRDDLQAIAVQAERQRQNQLSVMPRIGIKQALGIAKAAHLLLAGMVSMVLGSVLAFSPTMREDPKQLAITDMGPGAAIFLVGALLCCSAVFILRRK